MSPTDGRSEPQRRHTALIVGLGLVVVGLSALVSHPLRVPLLTPFLFPVFVPRSHAWDLLFLPGLGCVFLAWGVVARKIGLLIPGGVLAGIGLGVLANQGPLGLTEPGVQAGVIMASMGLGWAAVAALALVFVDRRTWWPLLPAAALGALGMALMLGGPAAALAVAAVGAPLALIAVGALMVWRLRSDASR